VCGAGDASTVAAEPLYFANGAYTYTWKTLSAWKGTCRELVVTLSDNTEHRATFDQVAAMRGREEGAVAAAPSRGPRDVS